MGGGGGHYGVTLLVHLHDRTEIPTSKGGVGYLNIPLLADVTKKISRDYGVLLEDKGVSLRLECLYFVISFFTVSLAITEGVYS